MDKIRKLKRFIFEFGDGSYHRAFGVSEKEAWRQIKRRQKNLFLTYCKCYEETLNLG